MINAGVEAMDVEEVKGLLERLTKGGEAGCLEVLQLRDERSVVLLPAGLGRRSVRSFVYLFIPKTIIKQQ